MAAFQSPSASEVVTEALSHVPRSAGFQDPYALYVPYGMRTRDIAFYISHFGVGHDGFIGTRAEQRGLKGG